MRPVAYRRGWVAEAAPGAAAAAIEEQRGKEGLNPEISPQPTATTPSTVNSRSSLETLAFLPESDGSWTLRVPTSREGLGESVPDVDQGKAELRLTFGSSNGSGVPEVISLPWPAGTTTEQVAQCTARLHRKRGELVLTLPPSSAAASPQAASKTELSCPPAAPVAPDPPPIELEAQESTGGSPQEEEEEEEQVEKVEEGEPDPPTPSVPSSSDRVEEIPVVPDDLSAKVDDFRRRLANQPQKALSFKKDGKTMQEVDVDPEAMDLAAALMLHSAAATGNLDLIKRLIDAKTDPNVSDEMGTTPLEKACLSSSIDAVELLLKMGASAKALPGAPSSPLHRAAAHGNAEGERLVRLLLEKRANPTYMDEDGRTAADTLRSLAGSSAVGSLRILRLLGA